MMIIGERLEERIAAKGISQSALGRRVGLSQSTINGLIKGEQRTTGKLHLIAREVDSTPAYLTGETDDPHGDGPPPPVLDSEERELVDHFSHLAPADRRALLQIARSMATGGAQPSETVHARGGEGSAATVHDKSAGYRGEPE
ncbi:helix-turn-helix domain-containing protein [Sphingobium sp.]|uniref:helix-turn-helix domain-containing protein n=1 Tax=Sphingobium sp. TaxID=1912891 RepID=UPI002E1BD2EB